MCFLKITLGRTTKDHAVDVDLKLEGPAWKISRKQGVIKLRSTGDFFIANEGKRSIFVDGQPVRLQKLLLLSKRNTKTHFISFFADFERIISEIVE